MYDYVVISAQMRVGLGVTFGMRWIWSSSSWWDFWAGCSGLCSTQSTYSWPNTEWNMCRRNIKLSGMKTSKFYNEMPLIIYTRNVQLYVYIKLFKKNSLYKILEAVLVAAVTTTVSFSAAMLLGECRLMPSSQVILHLNLVTSNVQVLFLHNLCSLTQHFKLLNITLKKYV